MANMCLDLRLMIIKFKACIPSRSGGMNPAARIKKGVYVRINGLKPIDLGKGFSPAPEFPNLLKTPSGLDSSRRCDNSTIPANRKAIQPPAPGFAGQDAVTCAGDTLQLGTTL